MSIISILKDSDFFRSTSDDLIDKLARMSKVEHYDKGDLIFAEDNPCTGMYVVAAGAIKVYKIGPDGREHVLHVAEPGETFGEVAMFLGSVGYPAYAGAVKKSSVVFIPKRLMLELLESRPELAFQVLGSLATWTHRLVQKLEQVTLKDASSRLAAYILAHGNLGKAGVIELNLAIPKHTLAAELAISSETLSRLLTRFEAEGLIQVEGRHIRVLDRDALNEMRDS